MKHNIKAIEHSLGAGGAGIAVTRPPARRAPARLLPGQVLTAWAPLRVVSEANQREHHMAKARRARNQRRVAALLCRSKFGSSPPGLPLVVTMTRISPLELDSDNLVGAFKAVRDGIADYLGVKDNNKRIKWDCAQERCPKDKFGVRIELKLWTEAP